MRITPSLQNRQLNNRAMSPNYAKSPLNKYNLGHDTLHFKGFGERRLFPISIDRPFVATEPIHELSLDTNYKPATFEQSAVFKGDVETGELIAKKAFEAGSLDTHQEPATFEDVATVNGEAKTGRLIAKKAFEAGSLDTNGYSARFHDVTTIRGDVKTLGLTASKAFTAYGNVDTSYEPATFHDATNINGNINTANLTVKNTFMAADINAASINAPVGSSINAKKICFYSPSVILGDLNVDSIKGTSDLTLGKITGLKTIDVLRSDMEAEVKEVERTLKFTSSDIEPEYIKIQLGDIYRLNVEVPNESVFEKLVFMVMDKGKIAFTLSPEKVAEFIASSNIRKIIR